jgi:hypothetical protein
MELAAIAMEDEGRSGIFLAQKVRCIIRSRRGGGYVVESGVTGRELLDRDSPT